MEKQTKYSVTKILDFHLGNPFLKLIEDGIITQEQLDFAGLKGSCVHKANELFLNSKEEDKEKLIWKIGTKFIKYLKDIDEKQRTKIITLINTSLNHLKKQSAWFFTDKETLTELKVEYNGVRGVIDWIEPAQEYIIHDFKTSSGAINKNTLERIKLQLTAYYWLATNNGYEIYRKSYIDHIKEKTVKVIQVDITDELIKKWEDMVDDFKAYQELQQGAE